MSKRSDFRTLRLELLESRDMLSVNMSSYEQLLLELINRARANPLAEAARYGIDLNQGLPAGTISSAPKQPLAPHQILINIAGAHSQDMLNNDYFSHTNLQGQSPSQRAQAAGYPTGVGENISWGGSTGSINQLQHVYARHESLFESAGHRQNMLTPSYEEIGVGVRFGQYTHQGTTYNASMVTENFGNPGINPVITGVVFTDASDGSANDDDFYSFGEQVTSGTITATNTSTGAVFTTNVGTSGGYALQVTSGTYHVVATNGATGQSYLVSSVVVGSENVKVDFETTTAAAGPTDVRLENGVVVVTGTSGDDHIEVTLGASHAVTFNGTDYWFASASVTGITIDGGGGTDQLNLAGTAADETAVLRVGQLSVTGAGVTVSGDSVELVYLVGGGGTDRATFYDSAANDLYQASSQYAAMFNAAFYNHVTGFTYTYGYATGGGYDEARMYDSAANDLYQTRSDQVVMMNATFYNWAGGFEYARGFATAGGWDEARMYDTPGNDYYQAWSHLVALQGANFFNTAAGFEVTRGMATSGGWDEARFYDTAGNDKFVARRNLSTMSGAGYHAQVEGYDVVKAFATAGGHDEATFYDTPANDLYLTFAGDANMSAAGQYYHRAQGFDVTLGHSTAGGTDEVLMHDSPGNDLYITYPTTVSMYGPGFLNWAAGFEVTRGYATGGGYDEVRMYDSAGNDLFRAWQGHAVMSGTGFWNEAEGFENQRGFATAGGFDEARLEDTPGNDHLTAYDWGVLLEGPALRSQAIGFERIEAHGIHGGVNTSDLAAIDYTLEFFGTWV